MARDFVPLPAGARGYLLGERSAQQAGQHEAGMLAHLMELEGRRRAQLQEQAFRGDLMALGPNPEPGALAQIAAKYAHPSVVLQSQQASADRRLRAEENAALVRERMDARAAELTQRAEDERRRQEQATRDREQLLRVAADLRPPPQPQTPVITEIADPADPTKAIKIDARTGRKVGDAPPKAPVERPLPPKLQADLIEKGQILDSTERFTSTFKDDYAGYKSDALGNAMLAAERKGLNPLSDSPARAQWWQDYELHQSVVRNKLFGSALTAPEIAAWERSAVTPGMRADHVRANLARREIIERTGLIRLARSSAVQYNKTAIAEALGRPIPETDSPKDDPLGIRK